MHDHLCSSSNFCHQISATSCPNANKCIFINTLKYRLSQYNFFDFCRGASKDVSFLCRKRYFVAFMVFVGMAIVNILGAQFGIVIVDITSAKNITIGDTIVTHVSPLYCYCVLFWVWILFLSYFNTFTNNLCVKYTCLCKIPVYTLLDLL